jgi:disulfide bond formation protein DsbB
MPKIRIIVGSLSTLALLMAFFYEYYLGYMPCDLCIYERIPYFLLIIISLIKNEKIFKNLSLFVLFCSIGMSVYHTQIESGVLPDNCAKKIKHSFSSEDIVKQINKVEKPSCGVVSAKIFDISMSTWNALFSILLFAMIYLFSSSNLKNRYIK